MKTFVVTYTFTELPSPVMYQSVTVDATNIGMAAHKGFQEIKKRRAVIGRRLRQARVSVVESNCKTEA